MELNTFIAYVFMGVLMVIFNGFNADYVNDFKMLHLDYHANYFSF